MSSYRDRGRGGARLSKALVYAAAMDAAKARMRAEGRDRLDEGDVEVYHATFARFFEAVGGAEGWVELPRD